ncbi:MAG: AttM/AiiB family protein [Myxococcaceae bacterium]|nr:AttM/AiiB family protein [Myxococcaceae bacterium]
MTMTKIGSAAAVAIAQLSLSLALGSGCAATGPTAAQSATPESGTSRPAASSERDRIRFFALDCGRIEITDIGFFTDSGKPTGKAQTLADPCFLIQHPKGTLLWDTGLKESIRQTKEGVPNPVGREFVEVSLREQLNALSLQPSDITFVGFSHLHADHAGNANAFTSSTWLLNRRELEGALKTPPPVGVDPTTFSGYKSAKVKLLDADEDVFGDGRVRILQTPGHTPGHQSLLVQLEQAGTLILSGDLTHTLDNWKNHVVPSFNDSRERTLASIGRVEALVAEKHARFIVQHAPEDFHALPKFPAYLE